MIPTAEDTQKTIRSVVEATIIDVMNNPGSELGNIIKKHVKESLECKGIIDKLSKKVHHYLDEDYSEDDEKSNLEVLFCEIVDQHKEIMKGKSIIEIEADYKNKHADLSDNETKVLSCLLRSDSPVRLSLIVGMSVEDFIETMMELGERFRNS